MQVSRQDATALDIEIRAFAEGDYEAVVAVANAVFPDRPVTVEEWRYDDEHFDRANTRLWEQVLASLQRRNAIAVRTTIQEAMAEGLRFAARLGFVEQMRMWESRLDVRACDLAQFRPAVERAEASGVRITTLAEELPRDPTALPRSHALNIDIGADTPQPDRFTPPDFQMFVDHFVESPGPSGMRSSWPWSATTMPGSATFRSPSRATG